MLLLAGQTGASTPGLEVIELLIGGTGADETASGTLDGTGGMTAEELRGCARTLELEIWTATTLDVNGTEDDDSGINISEEVVLRSFSPPIPGGISASSLGTGATDESGDTEIEDTGVLCWKALM